MDIEMNPTIRSLAFRAAEKYIKDPGVDTPRQTDLFSMANYIIWAQGVLDRIHHESHMAFLDQYGSGTAMGDD